MIKIMIVDDMPIFLEYLRGCIDWEAYGFEICAEAHDGKEALSLLQTTYPDVVLTDITMPYLNGLELSEIIVNQYPDISVILITGNNEFEYARKAVRIGVCDYIVKPFEKEELVVSLLKLKDNIERVLEMNSPSEEKRQNKKEQLLRSYFLQGNEQKKDLLQEMGVASVSNYYLLGVLHFKTDNPLEIEKIMNWESVLARMLKDLLAIEGGCEICKDYENNLVMIMNFVTEADMKNFKTYELQDFIQMIKNQLQIDCIIGISENCYEVSLVGRVYDKLMNVIREKEMVRGNKIIDCRKISIKEEVDAAESVFYNLCVIEEFTKALDSLQEDVVTEVINHEWNIISKNGQEVAIMNLLSGILSALMVNIINAGRTVEDIFGPDFFPYREICEMKHFEDRKDAVIAYCCKRISYEKIDAHHKEKEVAHAAKEYIEAHYMNPNMSITDISKELLVNQTYLRKMFKNEMDMTLTEYITKYRMHVAKKMILGTDQTLTAIACDVGYSDISYFSKCFKKYYGVSPKNMK